MPNFSAETAKFVSKLDAAVEAHLGWTRRVLRCAVLRESPGEEVLAPMAHTLCGFGRWFIANKAYFHKLDARQTETIEVAHRTMHDAIRSICADVMAGRPGQSAALETFESRQTELINLLAEFKTRILANATRHDPLTGLPLRYGLENEFLQVQKNCRRHRTLLYVGVIDADHFKNINDQHGHPVGDLALRHLADTLRSVIRLNEPLFRFGGEEFLVLMQCHSHEAAAAAAQRIVDTVRNSPLPMPLGTAPVLTVTVGLAWVADQESMTSAIERADRALYEGKKAGRDRYVVAASAAAAP